MRPVNDSLGRGGTLRIGVNGVGPAIEDQILAGGRQMAGRHLVERRGDMCGKTACGATFFDVDHNREAEAEHENERCETESTHGS